MCIAGCTLSTQVARSILRCDTISLSSLLLVVDQLSEEIQCGFLEFFRVFNDRKCCIILNPIRCKFVGVYPDSLLVVVVDDSH